MKIIFSTLCAAVLAMSPVVAGSASAASLTPHTAIGVGSQASGLEYLVEVQQRRGYQRDHRRGASRHGHYRRGFDHRSRRPPPYRPAPRSRSRGPDLGSAIVGAIIGGIIVNQFQHQPRTRHGSYLSRDHINWCHNRWRSYRVSDNSYQPFNGPRRVCVSPYGPS
ncbi:MAG: BA14K family protein [Pararhodobacter sp.]|nr:BA14K family protein [Pararhodobacter sp.]